MTLISHQISEFVQNMETTQQLDTISGASKGTNHLFDKPKWCKPVGNGGGPEPN